MLCRNSGQSSSNRSNSCPRYLNTSTPSMCSASSSPVRLNVASEHLYAINVSLLCYLIWVFFFVSRRTLVSDEPPRWHMHSTQVTVGQQFHPHLDHLHIGSEVAVHEILAESFTRYAILTDTPAPDISPTITPWGRTPHMWLELPLTH